MGYRTGLAILMLGCALAPARADVPLQYHLDASQSERLWTVGQPVTFAPKAPARAAAARSASLPAEAVARYGRESRIAYPIGVVKHTAELGRETGSFAAYGVRGVPSVVPIGRAGKVRDTDVSPEKLEARVRALIGR